jgi:myo-inositol-1-phosphate synthase
VHQPERSPAANSAGVVIDLIRCTRLAKGRGLAGAIHPAAPAFCKHSPRQLPDDEAFAALERFIRAN